MELEYNANNKKMKEVLTENDRLVSFIHSYNNYCWTTVMLTNTQRMEVLKMKTVEAERINTITELEKQ